MAIDAGSDFTLGIIQMYPVEMLKPDDGVKGIECFLVDRFDQSGGRLLSSVPSSIFLSIMGHRI